MTQIAYHISDDLLDAYKLGSLPHPFAVVVATHLSLCDTCRARLEAEDVLGGVMLESLEGVALSADARAQVMAALDRSAPLRPVGPSGIFPAPLMHALDGQPPRWRMLGGGIRQQVISADKEGSLRLLYIPPGKAVPEHGHGGLELTLVLQGSFSDSAGRFKRGDVETADAATDHQPVADPGQPCICLAATDAPLRFRSFLPRLLQPLFRI